jgi:DNA-binding transcriptional MerR regulator
VKVRELLMSETLPKKSFFKLSEVAVLLSVKPHEIHYWEAEFPQIRSQKTHSGQRIYRKEDVVLFSAIKHLLYDRKFTVAGARRVLGESDVMNEVAAASQEPVPVVVEAVPGPSEFLQEAAELLVVEDDDIYDEKTHEIYQECAVEIEQACQKVDPLHAGEMLSDALLAEKEKSQRERRLNKIEQEKAMAILMASKKSLSDVLESLDKITPSEFWQGF